MGEFNPPSRLWVRWLYREIRALLRIILNWKNFGGIILGGFLIYGVSNLYIYVHKSIQPEVPRAEALTARLPATNSTAPNDLVLSNTNSPPSKTPLFEFTIHHYQIVGSPASRSRYIVWLTLYNLGARSIARFSGTAALIAGNMTYYGLLTGLTNGLVISDHSGSATLLPDENLTIKGADGVDQYAQIAGYLAYTFTNLPAVLLRPNENVELQFLVGDGAGRTYPLVIRGSGLNHAVAEPRPIPGTKLPIIK